jgi:SAM-dependent methyltransferase
VLSLDNIGVAGNRAHPAERDDMALRSGLRFLRRRAAQNVLQKNNVEIVQFDSILDFGCGLGRVLRRLPDLTGAQLFGCDYNRKLIVWCRANLPFAEFSTNELERKLKYDDHSFDFVYALSVFTHLTASQHRF